MSVTHDLHFQLRPWSMPPSPGLPGGYWVAHGNQEGDASGGNFTWQHIFAQPSNQLGDPSTLFSIEQVMITVSIGTDRNVMLQIQGMDPTLPPIVGNNAPPGDCFYQFELRSDGVGNASVESVNANPRLWIGRFAGQPNESGLMNVRTTNPGATDFFRVKVQGYWWGAGAINAGAGIRIPLGGIYGAS